MGRAVADFDWSATSIGASELWPSELRAIVRTCLSTRFPVLVVWGPEMLQIYNDSYAEILGEDKHPRALGAPASEIWSEVWDTLAPSFNQVYETGEPTWEQDQPLLIERFGDAEERFFTYSYSPLFDDQGAVRGVVDIVTETTDAVVGRQRLGCLTDLGASLVGVDEITEVCVRAVAALGRWPDTLRSADVYLHVADELVLVASNRRERRSPGWLAVHDVRATPVVEASDSSDPGAPAEVSIRTDHAAAAGGLLVGEVNPHRPFDAGYERFLELVAQRIGAALDGATRHIEQIEAYRRIGDTLQEAMLKPASDFTTVAARYLPATGNLAVGGDWYDVIELAVDRRALIVGDCVGHGLEAAAAMSQLRAASRAMLLQGNDPAEMLDGLSLYAGSVDGGSCATAVCAIVNRREGTITYSLAGHPPPLVVSAAGTSWRDGARSTPLGVATSTPHTNAVHQLDPADIVVLYSDGLIERRGESLDIGLERLAEMATSLLGSTVQQMADGLLQMLLPNDAPDDVVVVVKQLGAGDDRR
ncbi:hypothetical protein BH10ACT3_BH10ACT3_01800 [soil metagenome]